MVNIDTIYQRVLALANKEQRGYITPQEFNLFANQAQMDIFEQYFYDLNQFMRVPGNDTNHADMTNLIEEKINIFEEETSISSGVGQDGSGNQIPVFNLTASAPDLYKTSQVRVYRDESWRVVEKVTKKQLRLMKGGPLTAPSKYRPVYTMRHKNNLIECYHDASTIVVDYIRRPKKVNWTYVVVNGKALVNISPSSGYQDFELHASEETKLVVKILMLAGVTLKDPSLYQVAAAEDNKNIQQEKQ
jgi:hypothetical protein